jgi:hypothetical protein
MKHFPLLMLMSLGWANALSQSFELVDKQDNYLGGTSQTISIPLKIKNTTDKAQFYIFRKVQDDLSADQKGYFCWERNCSDPELEEYTRRIEAGETIQNLYFNLETGISSGQHFIKFEIFPRGLPNQTVEHTVAITIEERAKTRVFNSREITVHDVYPNPVTDQGVIEYSIHSDLAKAKVVIHNILGKNQGEYELPASENKIKIQTEDLPSGVYFYTLYINNEDILTRKLIVRK